MDNHYQLSDQEFMQQFADQTLIPQWFTHTAHLRLAYCLLRSNSAKRAGRLMSEQIQAFDSTHGDGKKYHRTVTEAAVRVVRHFMRRAPEADFPMLLNLFPRLERNFKALLLTHYSPELLFDATAAQEYREPDLLAFDG